MDVARSLPGQEGSGSASLLPSHCPFLIVTGRAGGRSCGRSGRDQGQGSGLAVSQNDPAALRARPFWSRSGKPLDWVGALPAAWENVYSDLKGVISLLLPCAGCARHSPVLWAGGWGPRASSTAPDLAQGASAQSKRHPNKRGQQSCRTTKGCSWCRRCLEEEGRSGKASWRRWLLRAQ